MIKMFGCICIKCERYFESENRLSSICDKCLNETPKLKAVFTILTKEEVKKGRSSAYDYLL
jgi:hypothetical protein